jgi:hypothetical protein
MKAVEEIERKTKGEIQEVGSRFLETERSDYRPDSFGPFPLRREKGKMNARKQGQPSLRHSVLARAVPVSG